METLRLSTVQRIIDHSDITQGQKDLLKSDFAERAEVPDTPVYRIVVMALGAAIFIPLVPVFMRDSATAQMLLPIATGALGALAGLLAPALGNDY